MTDLMGAGKNQRVQFTPNPPGGATATGAPVRGAASTPAASAAPAARPTQAQLTNPASPPPTPTWAAGTAWAWNSTLGKWVQSTAAFRQEQQQQRQDPESVIRNPTTPIGGGQQQSQQRMSQESARSIVREFLREIDLPGLEDLLYNVIIADEDVSDERLVMEVRKTPEYAARFPGMELRRQQGRRAITEAEYLGIERGYKQMMQAAGLPQGFYDSPNDFGQLMGYDISVDELGRRVQDGYQAVAQADPSVKETLRAFYGVTDGELAAFFLDPGKAESLIMQQTATAQLGAVAAREGFGSAADRLAAERMQRLGVTEQEAQQAYSTLSRSRELLTPIEGGETALDVSETALGLTGRGGTEALQRLQTQARRRTARFEGGGRFATQGGDVVGLQQA